MLTLRSGELDLPKPDFISSETDVQQSLQAIVNAFGDGYNAALDREQTWAALGAMPHPLRGFAVEGAAMSSALLDMLTLSGGRRLRALGDGEGERYVHLIHVGAGWAFARLHVPPWHGIAGARPLIRWLAWDGWGFHQAYFRPGDVVEGHSIERSARGPVRPIRDQGVGRALWFYAGADPERIGWLISGFAPERQPDLWAGTGLAAAYTGSQSADVAERLAELAGPYRDQVAQGAAFAAKAHELSGSIPPRSADVIAALTGAAPGTASAWTDAAYAAALREGDSPAAYGRWRALIRHMWQRQTKGVPR